VKKGFKSWVVGKKVVSIRSKSACKSDPSLLVRRVFFPTTEEGVKANNGVGKSVSVRSHSWIAAGAEPDAHQFYVTIGI
jgi:hypothetical protein